MKTQIKMTADDGRSRSEQNTTLDLPARVIVTMTMFGSNVHVRIDIDERGGVTVAPLARVAITPNSFKGSDDR